LINLDYYFIDYDEIEIDFLYVIVVLLIEMNYPIQNVNGIENVNDYPNDLDQYLIDYFQNDYDF
jgi:hypothetical protein